MIYKVQVHYTNGAVMADNVGTTSLDAATVNAQRDSMKPNVDHTVVTAHAKPVAIYEDGLLTHAQSID